MFICLEIEPVEDVVCPEMACAQECTSGYKLGSDGCETCECLDRSVDCRTTCFSYCPTGFVQVR